MGAWFHFSLLLIVLALSEVQGHGPPKNRKKPPHVKPSYDDDHGYAEDDPYEVVTLKCPSFPYFTACVVQPNQCQYDQECQEGELCCQKGCNKICIKGLVTSGYDQEEEEHDGYYEGHPECSDYLKCAKNYKCVEYVTRCPKKCYGKCPVARTCIPQSIPDQCEYKSCPKNKTCKLHEVKCKKPPCYPEPRCVKKTKKRKKY